MKNPNDPIKNWTYDLLACSAGPQKCEKWACGSDIDSRGLKDAPDNLGYWRFNKYVIFWTSSLNIWIFLNTGDVGNKS